MSVSRAPFDFITRKYAFIDGECLRGIFNEERDDLKDQSDAYVDEYVRLVTQLAARMGTLGPYGAMYARLYRAYYYDAPVDSEHENHTRQQRILEKIEATAGFHVRAGTYRRRERKPAEQKEVDILLAVDMLAHAYRGNMHVALVVSDDLDFRPAIEECTRSGVYVVLGGSQRATKELRECADEFYDVSAVVKPPSS